MTNLDLIKDLNNLKKIKPDEKWLNSNRELLLAQVSNSGAESLSFTKKLLINLSSLSKALSQPAYALGLFILLIIGGSLLNQQVLVKAKPNDSLYIARIIAENVKVNTTINSQERNKLAAQYALVHAQDISSVLANPKFNTPANSAQVAKLSTSFNQEVNIAKSRINNLTHSNSNTNNPSKLAVVKKLSDKSTIKSPIKSSIKSSAEDFVIADSFKKKRGISMTINDNSLANISTSGEKISAKFKNLKATVTGEASTSSLLSTSSTSTTLSTSTKVSTSTTISTSTNLKASSSSLSTNPSSAANKILDEAQSLFNAKDYTKDNSQVIDKLKEVENIIK